MDDQQYALRYCQPALPHLVEYMVFATFVLKGKHTSDPGTYDKLKKLAVKLDSMSHFDENKNKKMVVCSVDIHLWNEWCKKMNRPQPLSSAPEYLTETDELLQVSPPYCKTDGHLFFHIKSNSPEGCDLLLGEINKQIGNMTDKTKNMITHGNRERVGFVYSNRIRHGIIGTVDPYNFSLRVLTGDEDPVHKGSCYCLTQKFKHNWEAINRMSDIQIEDMIGRNNKGNLVPDMYERSHLKRARVMDKNGINYIIHTQGQPYGDLFREREAGVYVSSYGKSLEAFNAVMRSMIGHKKGFILDEHLTVSVGEEGNMWYVPNAEELGLPPSRPGELTVPVDVFFKNRQSENGLMYYNTKTYLHHLAVQPGAENKPLSRRLIELAGNTFSRWHNEWYRNREYPRLGHLEDYHPVKNEEELEKIPIPERKGLSIKYMLGEILTDPAIEDNKTSHVCDFVRTRIDRLKKLAVKDCLLTKKVLKGTVKGNPVDLNFVSELMRDPEKAKELLKELKAHHEEHEDEVITELKKVVHEDIRKDADVFRIDATEIIVGCVPNFTLGTGNRVLRYLSKKEHLNGLLMALDENSMQGHVVPDYRKLVKLGLGKIKKQAAEGLGKSGGEPEKCQFYQSVIDAVEGVQHYFKNYAALARKNYNQLRETQEFERQNLAGIAKRMDKLSEEPPGTFLETAQLIFSVHCCFHMIGELVSIGRLDQILIPYYKDDLKNGVITEPEAQEIIDAFWLKMSEPTLMNRQFFNDYRTFGTCAMPYRGGAIVPQGNKASQWVMQITTGGYLPTGDPVPKDGCNEVTKMCLRASRHIPSTAPCVSLRVNPDTPDDILKEAALAVLSGGAHPFFFNDQMITNSLANFGKDMETALEDARDFCADGCYEPVFAGKTEFSLIYTPVPIAMEATLNMGAAYVSAGPVYLRGNNVSFQSPKPEDINSFEEFMEIFYRHYHWLASGAVNLILSGYGNLWKICPSPLLSSLTEGCMESGRDLTNGGAKYHIIAPMMLGISCVIDSLWAIKKLVFDDISAVTTLSELRECLLCDWGFDMIEPLHVKTAGPERADLKSHRYKFIREKALKLKKFGSGDKEIDDFGGEIATKIGGIYMSILEDPGQSVGPGFKATVEAIKKKYSMPGRPFKFKFTPAFGTFEDYLGVAMGVGASADGRRKGKSFASNFSPMNSPSDMPPDRKPRDIFKALKGWNRESFKYVHNFFSPIDINIREDFPADKLVEVLKAFGRGVLGFNMLTITCANLETLKEAVKFPEQYDLLRLRLGGWSEFYITMFPDYQEQQKRRPLFILEEDKDGKK